MKRYGLEDFRKWLEWTPYGGFYTDYSVGGPVSSFLNDHGFENMVFNTGYVVCIDEQEGAVYGPLPKWARKVVEFSRTKPGNAVTKDEVLDFLDREFPRRKGQ